MGLNGLANVNIELTSRCNKNCWICGRRERDRLYKDLEYGDMPFEMVKDISNQLSYSLNKGIVIQLHNNGESLLYPKFGEVLKLFKHHIVSITTNGKLLVKKADEIINNLNSISVSIIQDDPEADEQFNILNKFIEIKKDRLPFIVLRFVGDVNETRYRDLLKRDDVIRAKRVLHLPKGSLGYTHPPTVPEFGICVEFLRHLAIDRYGNVSCCVRFDPDGEIRLGNIKESSLEELWNGEKRTEMMKLHVTGQRNKIKFCWDNCQFWGIPISGE